MKCLETDELEALVEENLPASRAAEVAAHAGACASCGEELRWLKVERELIRRRAEPPAPAGDLWRGVQARLAAPPPRRRWSPYAVAAAAAAVAVAFAAGRAVAPHSPSLAERPGLALKLTPVALDDSGAVLDQAETAYRSAAATLEERYAVERVRLPSGSQARVDHRLARTRRQIEGARELAGRDVEARLAVLDGYADYVHSLNRLVSDIEVSQ